MQKYKMIQNLHTHSTFCDGRDTPEQMVERALNLGFESIGFSGHANTIMRDTCEMREKVNAYKSEICRLKKEYEGKIKIFLGTELDLYSEGVIDEGPYDYKIISVHYVKKGDEYIPYDYSAERTKDAIDRLYGGDGFAFAKEYYTLVADMPSHISGDIVGHFDLITKFSEKCPDLFDTGAPEYRRAAIESLAAIRERQEFFEVNTGAIGRGYRTTPYPDPFILKEMKSLNCKILITTDCHNRDYLDCGYSDSVELVRSAGFTEIYYLTDDGFVGRKI